MAVKPAERLSRIPPYLFAELDRKVNEARRRGVDVINLGIGDPDVPTPEPIVTELRRQAVRPENHRYPSYEGSPAFRQAVSRYYRRRFGVELDPETEVIALIGSKEGIAHISLAFTDPGSVNLVPDPGYPVYASGTVLAGGEPYPLPLRPEEGFLPRLQEVPEEVARRARLLFLNYPNNPTGATAPREFFEAAVAFARRHDLLVCHDASYVEIGFDGYRPPSFLQVEGAREVGVEFGSLSKTYNMTGWRVGWAAGNAEAIAALGRVKNNIDSGVFTAIQHAAIAALDGDPAPVERMRRLYQARRDQVVAALRQMGWPVTPPAATIYLWAPTPQGEPSGAFVERLFERTGVLVAPGAAYGRYGEGFFRISLSVPDARLEEALRRMVEAGIRFQP